MAMLSKVEVKKKKKERVLKVVEKDQRIKIENNRR